MSLPELGVGIIYSPELEPLLESGADLIGLFEVEPETLWTYASGKSEPYEANLDAIARLSELPQAKLVHGVGFPVGGSRPPDERHLPPLVETIRELQSPWASEHLGFNRAANGSVEFNAGFLLPPLLTPAGARAAARSVRSVADRLPVPFAVETGVNYLQPRPGELSDGAFVTAVTELADCGILLDLHNLWANERNGRQPLAEFLEEIPLERVWEVHIAGGSEFNGYWLDSHSGAVPEPLMAILAEVLPRLPEVRALVFEILPTFVPRLGLAGVREQLEQLRELWDRRSAEPQSPVAPPPETRTAAIEPLPQVGPQQWENDLAGLVIGREPRSDLARELASDPGLETLRQLVWNFRAGAISDTLKLTCRLLLIHGGDAFTREVLDGYFASRPPELFGSAEGEAFASYLSERSLDIRYLDEVLAFDVATLRVLIDGRARVVPFSFEPMPLLESIAAGRLPKTISEGEFDVEITPESEPISSIVLTTS